MTLEKNSILIIDDDQVSLKILRRYLGQFKLYEALDGEEGWEVFLKHSPDVVITDIQMPKLDGLTLFQQIKKQAPFTPVIILSGVGTMKEVIKALRLGAHDYLEKPVLNEEIVLHTVEKALKILRLEGLKTFYQNNLEKEVEKKTVELRNQLDAWQQMKRELINAHEEWQRTFDAIPDLIAILDRDLQIVRSNTAMKKALEKCSSKQHNPFLSTEYGIIHDTTKQHATASHDYKTNLSTEIFSEELGKYYELTLVPLSDIDGETLTGHLQIARDINERKIMEFEREKMQVKLLHTQKLESVGQLAAGIAHEINSPVQFVSSNNDFLEESFKDLNNLLLGYENLLQAAGKDSIGSSLLENLEIMKEEADWKYLAEEIPKSLAQNKEGLKRVTSIVRAMKEFSHPGSKEKELFNINQIIETTAIVARNEWKYVAELKLHLDPTLPNIMCYRDDIGQVFLNMIINSAHAIEEKLGTNPVGEKGKIEISSSLQGENIAIMIRDTGNGMPAKVVDKVFDPFFTTKKVGKGTGQGLAISWSVIKDKHKGELRVESTEGQGTAFTILIPVK